jgi:hypothetical protein
MTAQPGYKVASNGLERRLATPRLDILRALHSEKDVQHWSDEWTAEAKGRFNVISHTIRIELGDPSSCAGHVYAVRMSYDDLDLNLGKSRQIPDDYQLHFDRVGSRRVSWNISRREFEAVKQQHDWIKRRAGEQDL